MSKKSPSLRLLRKTTIAFAARVCLALVTVVFAASISVSPTTYQAEIGSYVNVVNSLSATDRGFSVASVGSSGAGTNASNPVQFSNSPTTANTSIVAGHWVYNVEVNSTGTVSSDENFTVSLTMASSSYGPLHIEGSSSPASGQVITCEFDVGATLPTSPYTFGVTIRLL
jgi:hypothetical protein